MSKGCKYDKNEFFIYLENKGINTSKLIYRGTNINEKN